MNYDVSKIPEHLQKGFKRNLTIKTLVDYENFDIKKLPQEQLDYIFKRDLDVITNSLEKYGFKKFSERIREFKRHHKKCPNCGKIYRCTIISSKYNCPDCKDFNDSKNNEKISKANNTAILNDSYKSRASKISEALKNKSDEDKVKTNIKRAKTIKEKYGDNFYSEQFKRMWENRTRDQIEEISRKISNTKLNWAEDKKQQFKNKIKEAYAKKTPEEIQSISDKADKTSIERYGYVSRFNSKEHRDKAVKTIKEKYGVENAMKIAEVREKMKQTMVERYGVENALQNKSLFKKVHHKLKSKSLEEIQKMRDKSKETNITKFGAEHHTQQHIKNYEEYNDKLFWVKMGEFERGYLVIDIHKICEYFDISYVQALNQLHKFNIAYIPKSKKNFKETRFLDELSYFLEIDIKRQYQIKPFNFKVDGYIENTNFKFKSFEFTERDKVIIEFLGDYWHGKLNNSEITYFGESFESLHNQTFSRFDKIKKAGYRILYIWESDYAENGISSALEY